MSSITLLGFVAGGFTTLCYLPQAIKIIKTQQTKDLSLLMYVANSIGTALWLAYGIALGQPAIWIANAITLSLILSILCLKLKDG